MSRPPITELLGRCGRPLPSPQRLKRYSATVIELTSTVTIRQPPSVVYAVLTDFERYMAHWADGPIAAQKTRRRPSCDLERCP